MKRKKQYAVILWLIGFFWMYMVWLPVTERLYECTYYVWIIISVLYDVLFFTFLSYAVEENSRGKLFISKRWKLIAELIVIDAAFSLLDYAIARAIPHRLIICDITVFVRTVLYGILLERYSGKKNYLTSKKKNIQIAVMAAFLIIEIVISYIINCKTVDAWSNIYKSDSQTLALLLDKSDGNHLLRTYLLLFLETNIMLLPIISCNEKEAKAHRANWLLKFIAIFTIMMVLSAIKLMVLPYYTAYIISQYANQSLTDFDYPVETPIVHFYRMDRKNQEYESFFFSKCKVKYKDEKIVSYPIYIIRTKEDYVFGHGESHMSYIGQWTRVETNEMSYDLFGDRYVVWIEDGNVKFCDMNKIEKEGENKYLEKICRWMVVNEKWIYFKPCAEYLNRYDTVFISQYFERYSVGDFTDSELARNSEINPQYIQNISQSYVA